MRSRTKEQLMIDLGVYLMHNGWDSYDPYDFQASPIYRKIEEWRYNHVPNLFPYSVYSFTDRFPNLSRVIIPKKQSAMSIAITGSGFLNLYDKRGIRYYLENAKECLDWLCANSSVWYHGYCWGLPFDWRMSDGTFLKAGTPCSTVTPYVVDALLHGYESMKKDDRVMAQKYLDAALLAGRFYAEDLKYSHCINTENYMLMSSYSPIDRLFVVNASSYVAASLLAIYKYTRDPKHYERAKYLMNFVYDQQRENGSWNYWSDESYRGEAIDSLHQCYILQNLLKVQEYFPNPKSINKGVNFYVWNFYRNGLISKFERDNGVYELIDVAEAINLFYMLGNKYFLSVTFMNRCIERILSDFNSTDTFYIKSSIGRKDDLIPYSRWGQSQAFYALTLGVK